MGNQCCGCVSLSDQGLGNNRVGSAENAPGTRLADTTDSAVEIKAGLCNADPITKQGKRIQMAQMLCIPLVPIVILVVQACLSLVQSVASKVQHFASTIVSSDFYASAANNRRREALCFAVVRPSVR